MRISDWSSDVCSSDLAFALGRDLAGQDVARLDLGADIDDPRLVEVAQRFLADIGDVAGDVFRPELGVAGHHLEFVDMDRGEAAVLHDPRGKQGRSHVLITVPALDRQQRSDAKRSLAEKTEKAAVR